MNIQFPKKDHSSQRSHFTQQCSYYRNNENTVVLETETFACLLFKLPSISLFYSSTYDQPDLHSSLSVFYSTSFVHSSCNRHTCACPSLLGNSIPKHTQLGPRERLSTSIHQVKTRRSASKTNSNATETILSCSSSYAAPLHTCRFSPHSCSSLLHYGSVSLLFRLSSRLLHSLFSHSLSMKNKYFQPNWP